MRNPISRGKFTYNLGPTVVSAEAKEIPAPVVQAPSARPQPNRKVRRKNALFNRLLTRRLKKEELPAQVEILPDGGVHVTVDTREEEKGDG